MMDDLDDYIDELIAGWPLPPTIKMVLQNILDEPIPEAVKMRLLKPLLPRQIPPTRKRKLENRLRVLR
jgi:hypothetical protein